MSQPETSFTSIDYRPLLQRLERKGIVEPTRVQAEAIDTILDGVDAIVSAPTGSGKTLAFLLPILQSLLESPRRRALRALVLTPTRELARQIVGEARELCDRDSVNVIALTGGDHKQTQMEHLTGAEFLVATPGRLAEYVAGGLVDVSEVEFLVVDEADRTLDMGFADQVTQIALSCPTQRQTLLFSATLAGSGVQGFVEALTDPDKRQTIHVEGEPEHRSQEKILVDDPAHAARLLPELLAGRNFERAIVFANKRDRAETLHKALVAAGLDALVLHGDVEAKARKQVHQRFAKGQTKILVATDLAARGLDVAGVDLVVNAELPYSVPGFIHRAGRTGRMGRAGAVVSLVSAQSWNRMASIERYLGGSAAVVAVPGCEASYKGPKKTKSSGKAVVAKKNRSKADKKKSDKDTDKPKTKQRLRDRKNIGKRRKPAAKE